MDTFGPHFSRDLFGPNGRLTRLHKGGGGGVDVPRTPARAGEPAKTIEQQKERDPNKRNRGFGSTILTTGLGAATSENYQSKSILGG